MSFQVNIPPSLLARATDDAEGSAENKKKTREDYKKMKELEEARKSATVPAMKDEEGNDINPHIPQYIMQVPWYYGATRPTLKHQRIPDGSNEDEKEPTFDKWYFRGTAKTTKAKKWLPGSCENCGSTTHKKKDCLEKPRKVGARFSGRDMAYDDLLQPNIKLGYEAKRDRWNGYDPSEHKKTHERFQRLEEARRLVRAQQLEEQLKSSIEADGSSGGPKVDGEGPNINEDEDRYGEDMAMPGQKFDSKQRQSIRNLRLREDTAKYLYNLDPNSAYYDPKTRSMRENPFSHTGKEKSEVPFAGDNFVRYSGDSTQMLQQQVFAWEMHNQKGLDLHLQADPTRLAMLERQVKEKAHEVHSDIKNEIIQKYGGEEHMQAPPQELLMGQSEAYVEYSRTGKVIKGVEKTTIKSRYVEDVHVNNHTSVWGSFWRAGQWGYKCCQSTLKESYCTGMLCLPSAEDADSCDKIKAIEHVKAADDSAASVSAVAVEDGDSKLKRKRQDGKKETKTKRRRRKSESSSSSLSSSSSSDSSSGSDEEEEKAVRKAMEKEKKRQKALELDDRKRNYTSHYDGKAVTDAELEAFYRMRRLADDPMLKFSGKEDDDKS